MIASRVVLVAGCVALATLVPRLTTSAEGTVHDDHGPVAGARVRWQGSPFFTLTDRGGRFRLPGHGERVTAWKAGHFIAAASRRDLRLMPLPDRDDADYEWVDPTPGSDSHSCGDCHAAIHDEWAASGHARSATGRHFRGLYDDLARDFRDGLAVCTSCHAPGLADDDPAAFDLRHIKKGGLSGVHCDYCHKVADVGTGTPGLTHGRDNLRLLRPSRGQVFFGPLDDANGGDDAYSPLYRDSRYCASCHEGVVFGVPVYTTYSEWLESPARRQGKQCQSCHTPPTGRLTNIAPGHGGVERDPRTLGNHAFFDGGLAEMLRRGLSLGVRASRGEEGVSVAVTVAADGAGHRVPTGFIDRQVLLVVEASTKDGKPVRGLSGPTLPAVAGTELAGQRGRLYAKWLRDETGTRAVPFWLAAQEPLDTRLTPGKPDSSSYRFPANVADVRVRLLYRRFWADTSHAKDWPDRDLLVTERLARP